MVHAHAHSYTCMAVQIEEFQSTLERVDCGGGRLVSFLRAWNGELFCSLTEMWCRHFPEVNRNRLTRCLNQLGLDTLLPTGQQVGLMRQGSLISNM